MSNAAAVKRAAAVVDQLRAAGCVFAEDEARLLLAAAGTKRELAAMVQQRIDGRPLEQILGWAEFCGLRIAIDEGVFVPRRRTEFLVRQAVAVITERVPPVVVVDLCCGSAAVGAAIVALAGRDAMIDLHATDIDPAAVRCARRNLARLGAAAYCGNLYDPLPAKLLGQVDVLVANVPYVPTEAIALLPPEARDHEPRAALDGGADGLDMMRRVAAGAPEWLAPGGALLVEISEDQGPAAAAVVSAASLSPRVVASEEFGTAVVIGVLRSRRPPARRASRTA